ncbi:MAG TPA: DUF6600 domain-containing protein, partial [Kofleriaceae bacterium]|nr:DUF6600 domain-containing protein [Kofleriaceae bacterium]
MRRRTSIVGLALLVAGCIPTNPPPSASYGPPPPPPQPGYQEPQPGNQPAPQPGYQPEPPPPSPEPYQPPPEPPRSPEPVSEPYVPSGPVYVDINAGDVAGEEVPAIDVFYDQLDPYGSWYDDRTYGWVFAPSEPSYIPYANGYWKNTDYGFTWVSSDPFGWATDHYGRWVWVNRWVWVPDTTWGPAWVQWRVGDGWVGWAPMGFSDDAYVPDEQWRFVPALQLTARDLRRSYVIRDHRRYLSSTAPLQRWNRHRKSFYVAGPDDDWLRRWRIQPRRERVDLSEIGRYDRDQRREAERRAREHHRQWEDRQRREEQVRRDLDARQRRAEEDRR